jgi:hypothetical protein
MKKAVFLIVLACLVTLPAFGHAKPKTYNILVAGGSEQNMIHIWLTPDGRSYVIESLVQLEVGGTICANPERVRNELICEASLIGSFEVNSGEGDDVVSVARDVAVPVTLRGGAGDDVLVGEAGGDKLVGGPGNDKLVGRSGPDWLYGGAGDDRLIGGRGEDLCRGGPGSDAVSSCERRKEIP